MTPEKLLKNFQRCKDWEERYLYLMELGERMCNLSEEKRTDESKLRGCQSQVWVSLSLDDGNIKLDAFSDAGIVRGLLALIIIAYNDTPIDNALDFDIKAWFESLDLEQHLTPTRTMGLNAIVKQVQQMAQVNA